MSTSHPGGTASVNQRALLLAAKNDHNPALEELMRCYEPLIGAIVASLRLPCGCEHADVAQEARLGLLQAIRAWQPARGPFRAFAALCARNQALKALDAAGARKHQLLSRARSLDEHEPRRQSTAEAAREHRARSRRTRTRRQFNAPLGEQLSSTSTDADPLRIVIAREQLDALIAVRQTMTTCERQVLTGTLNDKSQRQLAAELGWSRKTVMLAQRSAREKLVNHHALAA